MSDIESRVKRVVAEQLGKAESDILLESNVVTDLHADSLDKVELVMAIEDEFCVEIDDDTAEGCQTVAQIVEVVKNRRPS
jgi:acyl carrier protein